MKVFLNGRFLAAARANVSAFDRGFLYGDGLFETVRVHRGRPFLLERHLERLQRGAEFLRLRPPYSPGELTHLARELLARNHFHDGLLRLHLSRGPGVRGYSMRGADHPTTLLSLHPLPPGAGGEKLAAWGLATANLRLCADDPLLRHKTANKLPQILARAEAETHGADEALLFNTNNHAASAAGANLFWIERGEVFTPALACGALPGVTRGLVMELCLARRLLCREARAPLPPARRIEGIFLTLSSFGLIEAASLDGVKLRRSPMTRLLWQAYRATLKSTENAGD